MKRILCYGDSNTWGYDPRTKDRYPAQVRWTGVLQAELGDDYLIIEEGLNGRTTVWDDPIQEYTNGKTYLIPCLASQRPLDLVIIMLGTNDLKKRFSVPAYDIASGAEVLVAVAKMSDAGRDGKAPPVLLMAPPPLATLSDFADMFQGGESKSQRFSRQFQRVAQEQGCFLLDAREVIVTSEVDGVHFDPEEHAKLGKAVAQAVVSIV
jgi:lysophospholipase L1-like esterase